jgi:hypothetical protein
MVTTFGLLINPITNPDHVSIYTTWRIDPLIGNDRETNNETTAVAWQRPARNNGSNFGGRVFCVVRSEVISRDRPSSVQ